MSRKKILLIGILFLGGYLIWKFSFQSSQPLVLPGKETLIQPSALPVSDTHEERVDEVGLSLQVPNNFYLTKELQMNFTTNEPYAVSFTIQNYQDSPSTVPEPYQLYGIYQWDTEKTSKEDFLNADFALDPSTREETMVAGLPTVKGLTQGERSRYTLYILKDGHTLILAADGTDQAHMQITDALVESMQFE